MASPLDPFVSGSKASSDVNVGELPKLTELVKELGFSEGLKRFDEEMERWRLNLERMLNERLQSQSAVSIGPA